MFAEGWPLLVFSILSQLSIGTFVILMLVYKLIGAKDDIAVSKVMAQGMLFVIPVMALANVFSMFHLGSPFIAYLAIANVKTSWLSREILTGGGFLALSVIYFLTCRQGKPMQMLGWLTAIMGLATVFCTASVYNFSIFPAWAGANTYITFYAATILLGSAGTAVLLTFRVKENAVAVTGILRRLAVISGVSLLVPLLYLPVYISGLSGGEQAALASAKLFGTSYAFPMILRWLLSLVGLGIFLWGLYKQDIAAGTFSMKCIYTVMLLVFAGECVGRYIFYATAVAAKFG